jgi:hypothetical protein
LEVEDGTGSDERNSLVVPLGEGEVSEGTITHNVWYDPVYLRLDGPAS